MMNKKLFLLAAPLILLFSSCSSREEVAYFQNVQPDVTIQTIKAQNITLKEGDMLSIIVSSKNPELAVVFNLPEATISASNGATMSGTNQGLLGYTVNSSGNIDFPVLGTLHIAGMTKEQVAQSIKDRLLKEGLLKDPVVTVNFQNLKFSILGDVNKPGQYKIEKDKIDLLEAISMAGDLNITGRRDNILLTRADGDTRTSYQVDLRNQSFYQSPAFYVQQNDVIYVEPNQRKANEAALNANLVNSPSFWVSIASFFTAISVLLTD